MLFHYLLGQHKLDLAGYSQQLLAWVNPWVRLTVGLGRWLNQHSTVTRTVVQISLMQRGQVCGTCLFSQHWESERGDKRPMLGPGEAKIVRNCFYRAGEVMHCILSMDTWTHRVASRGEGTLTWHPAKVNRNQVIIEEAEVKAETLHLQSGLGVEKECIPGNLQK